MNDQIPSSPVKRPPKHGVHRRVRQRKLPCSQRRVAGFTLLECIVVIVIAAGLLGGVLRVTHECWTLCRRSLNQAWARQETVMLGQRWRRFVHGCVPGDWEATSDGTFAAGDRSAEFIDQRLVLRDGDERLAELALPRNMTACFSVETPSDLRPCAVLILSWETEHGKHTNTHSVRLVACAQPETTRVAAERKQP